MHVQSPESARVASGGLQNVTPLQAHYLKPNRDYTIWKPKFGTFILLLYICSRKCINNNERIMNNADFWASIRTIIAEGFTPEGLLKLDSYAAQFISGKLVYQRFSPQEQHGCSAGGTTNVIASLLAGAEAGTDSQDQGTLSDYQRACELGTQQEAVIEQWAKAVGLWTPWSPHLTNGLRRTWRT